VVGNRDASGSGFAGFKFVRCGTGGTCGLEFRVRTGLSNDPAHFFALARYLASGISRTAGERGGRYKDICGSKETINLRVSCEGS
jgi:hypothetical protein